MNDIITEIFGDTIKANDKEIRKTVILALKNIDVLQMNNDTLTE